MKSIFNPELVEFLEEKTGCADFDGSRNWLNIRCPNDGCSDNTDPKDHGHCGVSVREPFFNCFKCGWAGSTIKLIKYLGGDPKKYLLKEVFDKDFNKYAYKKHKHFGITNHKIAKIDSNNYKLKSQYIKGRLGFNYPIDRISGLVYNIKEFIKDNNIVLTDDKLRLLDYFESSFVGFLTARGTKLILRNIDPSASIEHAKIDLESEGIYFKDFFGIKTGYIKNKINTIVLAEGVFDILVALEHYELLKIRRSSCYWAAVLSNHYTKSIVSVLDFCKIPKAHVIILSDRDKDIDHFRWVSKNPFVYKLEVYHNKLGNDFGKTPIGIVKSL